MCPGGDLIRCKKTPQLILVDVKAGGIFSELDTEGRAPWSHFVSERDSSHKKEEDHFIYL